MVTREFKNAVGGVYFDGCYLSLAPTRNKTWQYTRCPCFLKDEVNFTNKSRIRHGSNQLLACLKPLLPI